MGYSYMTIRKYHDFTSLARAYAHNYRLVDIPNAAPGLRGENQELVKCEDKNGNAVTYAESVRERVKNLTYYKTHRLRRNAVLAMDVLVSFSREDIGKVDLEKWKQENVRWLQETFNRDSARNGENVISVVFHGDECGSPHCHAFVLPVTEDGRFCASEFTGDRKNLRKLQDSYGKAMEVFGLKRGIRGSSARHRDIRKFYGILNQAMVMPEALEGETIEEYRSRVTEEVQEREAAGLRKILETETHARQRMGEERQRILNETADMVASEKAEMEQELRKLRAEARKAAAERDAAKKDKDDFLAMAKDLSRKIREMDRGMEMIKAQQHLELVMQYCREEMPAFVEKWEENFAIMEDVYAQKDLEH